MAGLRRMLAQQSAPLRLALEQTYNQRDAARIACTCGLSAYMQCLEAQKGMHTSAYTGLFASLRTSTAVTQARATGRDMTSSRRSLFIQVEKTPNPTSMMFLPGKPVLESGTQGFLTARESMASPLAKALFQIDGVQQVFFGTNFVTVTKTDTYPWAVLKPDIFAAITDFYSSGKPVLLEGGAVENLDNVINDDDDEVVAMIKELLETRIRPAVQEDGGDVSYKGFDPDSGIVTLKMLGACSGCPSSAITLKNGIENMMSHYVPEVKGVVEAPADESEQAGLAAFNELEKHLSN
uniref:Scaffold protein Nfu/NifU N-terminal domain-containing protein n=2 Tax=Auxenochlorella protothecoides TaxID=3075 RepID=A0A1D2AA69_AUXPR